MSFFTEYTKSLSLSEHYGAPRICNCSGGYTHWKEPWVNCPCKSDFAPQFANVFKFYWLCFVFVYPPFRHTRLVWTPAELVFFFCFLILTSSSWSCLLVFSVPPPPRIAHPEPPTLTPSPEYFFLEVWCSPSSFLMTSCFQIRLPENPLPEMVPSLQIRLSRNSTVVS